MVYFSREKQIRHGRVLDLRKKIQKGWTMKQLLDFCQVKLEVARITAISYIDEAAEPYRIKYLKENPDA